MPLLQVQNLTKFYGANQIIDQAAMTVQPGEKIGLVGKNGSGKTTLMKILTGVEDFDGGEIAWSKGARIGYLAQTPQFTEDSSIYLELRGLFRELDLLQNTLNQLQQKMSLPGMAATELDALIREYHTKTEEFEQAGGYQIEGRIQGVLRGLGFPKERWNDSPHILSGGEQTRLSLAKMLLSDNDILLLDEPTNYLDVTAIEWLEKFLNDFQGAVLLISHDRFFLDRVVSVIYEIEGKRLKRYKGNYSAYRRQKEAEYYANLKAYEEQQKYINRQEKFIRESRAAEKSKRKAHSLEKRLAQVERIAKPIKDDKSIKLQFRQAPAGSRQALVVEGLTKSFGVKCLVNGVSFKVEAGEKVGVLGPNGSGKTTLLRMILGLEPPDQGRVRFGYEVYPGYFPQIEPPETLTGTPFSQVMDMADLDNTQARTILGRFLFSGDAVFKAVADLSGGERRRLGLIKLMLSGANFLVLDEPTNHLDLESIEAVESALKAYEGTILIVSHDRYFLNQIVDRYLLLDEGRLRSFVTYQDYEAWRQQRVNLETESEKQKSYSQQKREQTKEMQRDLKRKQRNLFELEADINNRENQKNELLNMLNNPEVHTDYQKSYTLSQQLTEIENELEKLYKKWEQLQAELEIG
ncbi:MAG: ABC-F family ATP-binding cassette domain-containing protein [Firmicutes bacterium]|nr:ABC-F family ATP-binding cassette domain-containing protein [Bacillota bacterium]